MTLDNKMSENELRQQADKITGIDDKVTGIDDKFTAFAIRAERWFRLWPIFTAFGGMVTGIVVTTLWLKNYDSSLVKQPQFQEYVVRASKTDSALNVKIDTGLAGVRTIIPHLRLTKVIQHRDKYGNISYAPSTN